MLRLREIGGWRYELALEVQGPVTEFCPLTPAWREDAPDSVWGQSDRYHQIAGEGRRIADFLRLPFVQHEKLWHSSWQWDALDGL